MQTFIISPNPKDTAKILDNKRLGKQRIEAIQIANILLGMQKSNAWKNHPAVLMWKGYEPFLIIYYLQSILTEWSLEGFENKKCLIHYNKLEKIIRNKMIKQPKWFCKKLFRSHKSNLIRKNKEYYSKYWPNIPDNLGYWWPTKNGF